MDGSNKRSCTTAGTLFVAATLFCVRKWFTGTTAVYTYQVMYLVRTSMLWYQVEYKRPDLHISARHPKQKRHTRGKNNNKNWRNPIWEPLSSRKTENIGGWGGKTKQANESAERRSYSYAAAAKISTETSPSRWTSRHDPPPRRLANPAKNELSRSLFRFWSEMQRRDGPPHLVASVHAATKVSVKAGSSASSKTTSHLLQDFDFCI